MTTSAAQPAQPAQPAQAAQAGQAAQGPKGDYRALALRTDNLFNPVGLGDTRPLLSWQVAGRLGQSAYEVRMADSRRNLRRGDIAAATGKVVSSQHDNVTYTGPRLHSRQTVAWQVRVWDTHGDVSAWSRPATWEMGLIGKDAWRARWIENPDYNYTQPDGVETPLPVFGKSFRVGGSVAKARLYVTGLGMYAATVNGRPAGKAVLEPGQTTYADEVDYRTYDVTRGLRRGANVIGIATGSGTYQRVPTPGHYFFGGGLEQFTTYGEPKVIAQLEVTYTDGRHQVVASNASWRTALGATTYSSWWSGEEYDARRASVEPSSAQSLTGSGWRNAGLASLSTTTVPRASTPLVANPRPPVTVARDIRPQSITKVDGSWVLDFGANRAGWPKITLNEPAGTTITMTPAETVNADGTINVDSTGASSEKGAIAYKYTSAGRREETWHPQFTYSGFRYLRLDGLTSRPRPGTVTMQVVHADNPRASTFDSSSTVLDQVHKMTLRSTESNMMSVLTDCPDREKGPYTGDNLHNIDTLLTQFDMSAYEPQLVKNMATAQRKEGDESPGLIANIAPEFHRVMPLKLNFPQGVIEFLDEVNWGGAIIRIPWQLYTTYGDTRTMSLYYENMVKWLDYEAANRSENKGDIPGLGDWSATDNSTPMQLTIYAGYYTAANDMSKIAQVLGKKQDASKYRSLAGDLAKTFTERFRHTDAAGVYYGSDSEASDAMALDAGLVPDEDRKAVQARLVASVRRSGNHITTGSVALGPLFRALQAAGRDDVIYDMVTNPTAPGYGYLVATGHTTLSEDFNGGGSQNHHFLGQVDNWLVSGVAGIQQSPGSVGYRHLIISPAVVGELSRARGSYQTPQGTVATSWRRTPAGHLELHVLIPAGTTATVRVPGGKIATVDGIATHTRSISVEVGAGPHVIDAELQ